MISDLWYFHLDPHETPPSKSYKAIQNKNYTRTTTLDPQPCGPKSEELTAQASTPLWANARAEIMATTQENVLASAIDYFQTSNFFLLRLRKKIWSERMH